MRAAHTHTRLLATLVCSHIHALCYCFAFAASATPPPSTRAVRNHIVPLTLMLTALNIVSCCGPMRKKILRTFKVLVVVGIFFHRFYNWHRLAWLLVSMCMCVCM